MKKIIYILRDYFYNQYDLYEGNFTNYYYIIYNFHLYLENKIYDKDYESLFQESKIFYFRFMFNMFISGIKYLIFEYIYFKFFRKFEQIGE